MLNNVVAKKYSPTTGHKTIPVWHIVRFEPGYQVRDTVVLFVHYRLLLYESPIYFFFACITWTLNLTQAKTEQVLSIPRWHMWIKSLLCLCHSLFKLCEFRRIDYCSLDESLMKMCRRREDNIQLMRRTTGAGDSVTKCCSLHINAKPRKKSGFLALALLILIDHWPGHPKDI